MSNGTDGGTWSRLLRTLASDLGGPLLRGLLGGSERDTSRSNRRETRRPSSAQRTQAPTPQRGTSGPASGHTGAYPGDYTGPVTTSYSPTPDGRPDPGEIVWAWVPYEEDHSQGKDRPALVIGVDETWLLALPVTSKDHDRDAEQEARAGRYWMDIGVGAWDPRGRPSEVRLNRIVRLDPDAVRREGAALDRATFDRVVAALR